MNQVATSQLKQKIEHDCLVLRDAMYSRVTESTSIVTGEKYRNMDEHVAQLELLVGKKVANAFAVAAYEKCAL